MKTLFLAITLLAQLTFANTIHDHHAKHGMVLIGEDKVFASHIVYKVPHNYQILMEVELTDEAKQIYRQARQDNPTDLLILVLNPMDISQIQTVAEITGTLVRETTTGERVKLLSDLTFQSPRLRSLLPKFKVLYFDELPLSLNAD